MILSAAKRPTEIGNSFANPFIMTAMRLEALTERFLFKPAGLSAASFKILAFVKNSPGCSPSQMLNYLGGTKSNITQRLNFLEKHGLVYSKRPSTGDKRKVFISITPAGNKKFDGVISNFKKNSIYLEKFFNKQELSGHCSFMMKLNLALDKCERLIADRKNN